jgi:hypothetical protein
VDDGGGEIQCSPLLNRRCLWDSCEGEFAALTVLTLGASEAVTL